MNLLIVEDDQSVYDLIEDAIEENSDFEFISTTWSKSLNEAIEKLNTEKFDGAIIDISLQSGRPELAEGNELLDKILGIKTIPIRVSTGNTNKILDRYFEKQSEFFKIYSKDEKRSQDLLQDFVRIYNSGITKLLGGEAEIEKRLTDIFLETLSK